MAGGQQPKCIRKQKSLYSKNIHNLPKATADDVDEAYRAAALAKKKWDAVNPFEKEPF